MCTDIEFRRVPRAPVDINNRTGPGPTTRSCLGLATSLYTGVDV